jgi:hypothetical protein
MWIGITLAFILSARRGLNLDKTFAQTFKNIGVISTRYPCILTEFDYVRRARPIIYQGPRVIVISEGDSFREWDVKVR